MKRSLIAASVLSAVFMSAGAFAVDEYDSGVLNINGRWLVLPVNFWVRTPLKLD